jgi:hypothetical protein
MMPSRILLGTIQRLIDNSLEAFKDRLAGINLSTSTHPQMRNYFNISGN